MRRREFITLSAARRRGRSRRGRSSPSAAAGRRADARSADDSRSGLRGVPAGAGAIWLDRGRNVRIDTRWGTANPADIRRYAAELVALAPDVILAMAARPGAVLQATRTIPIVFPAIADPVGAGFVDSLARPGGNATGFMNLNTAWARNGWNCSRRSRRL